MGDAEEITTWGNSEQPIAQKAVALNILIMVDKKGENGESICRQTKDERRSKSPRSRSRKKGCCGSHTNFMPPPQMPNSQMLPCGCMVVYDAPPQARPVTSDAGIQCCDKSRSRQRFAGGDKYGRNTNMGCQTPSEYQMKKSRGKCDKASASCQTMATCIPKTKEQMEMDKKTTQDRSIQAFQSTKDVAPPEKVASAKIIPGSTKGPSVATLHKKSPSAVQLEKSGPSEKAILRTSEVSAQKAVSEPPVVKGPSATPIGTEQSVTPTQEEPSATPIEKGPSVTPTQGEPSATPIEKGPSVTPTQGEPSATPIEKGPSVTPTQEEPSATPTEKEPSVTPKQEEPSATPIEKEPSMTLTEKKPSVTPAQDEPPVLPQEKGRSFPDPEATEDSSSPPPPLDSIQEAPPEETAVPPEIVKSQSTKAVASNNSSLQKVASKSKPPSLTAPARPSLNLTETVQREMSKLLPVQDEPGESYVEELVDTDISPEDMAISTTTGETEEMDDDDGEGECYDDTGVEDEYEVEYEFGSETTKGRSSQPCGDGVEEEEDTWGWKRWDRFISLLNGEPIPNPCFADTCQPEQEDEGELELLEQEDCDGCDRSGELLGMCTDPTSEDTYILLIALPLVFLSLMASFKGC